LRPSDVTGTITANGVRISSTWPAPYRHIVRAPSGGWPGGCQSFDIAMEDFAGNAATISPSANAAIARLPFHVFVDEDVPFVTQTRILTSADVERFVFDGLPEVVRLETTDKIEFHFSKLIDNGSLDTPGSTPQITGTTQTWSVDDGGTSGDPADDTSVLTLTRAGGWVNAFNNGGTSLRIHLSVTGTNGLKMPYERVIIYATN
jgi:hypothetical protein